MWYNLASVEAYATSIGADVAQLVEQLIRNEQVTGSIPAIGSIENVRAAKYGYFLWNCMLIISYYLPPGKTKACAPWARPNTTSI